MIDILAYPHILRAIANESGRATVCVLLRTSSSVKELLLPVLYPAYVIDPITSRYHSAYNDKICHCHSPSQPHSTSIHLRRLAVQSFLSSPHLQLAQSITITNPYLWGEHLGEIDAPLFPAQRGEGTTTIIHIRPWESQGDEMSGEDSESEENDKNLPGDTRNYTEGNHLSQGSVDEVDAEEEEGSDGEGEWEDIPSDDGRAKVVTTGDIAPAPGIIASIPYQNEYQHIFDIAALIPSSRLIIYVPPSADVDLKPLMIAMCAAFDPPQPPQTLTIIIESGNRLAKSIGWFRRRKTAMPWRSLEIILIPDPSGVFPSLPYHFGRETSSGIILPADSLLASSAAEMDTGRTSFIALQTLLGFQIYNLGDLAQLSIVGIEGTQISPEVKERFPPVFVRALERVGQIGKGSEVKFLELAKWKKGASAACLDLL